MFQKMAKESQVSWSRTPVEKGTLMKIKLHIMETPLLEFKQVVISNTLRRCELFREPCGVDLHALVPFIVTKGMAKGEFLFREGEDAYGFYIVQRGSVNLYRMAYAGREQLLRIARPGEAFAEETLFLNGIYQTYARAAEPCQVLFIPKAEFIALLRRHPELSLRMLRMMSRHLCTLLDLLENLRLKDVKTRVAGWFVEHCSDPLSYEPCQIHITTTKRALASELGIASETLSRIFRRFQRAELIEVRGNQITLLCPVKLTQLVEENCEQGIHSGHRNHTKARFDLSA
jgi:CRP/FNR family transcriptional regulator, dissimilatory nitrate respiration regulator